METGPQGGLGWQIRNAAQISKQLTSSHRDIRVTAGPQAGVGLRLDLYLAHALPSLSRSLIKRWLDRGWGTVDGHVAKASHRVHAGEQIHLLCPLPSHFAQHDEPPPLHILYESDGVLICNKPPGQLAHQAGRVLTGTVLNQIQDLLQERGGDPMQARLVNRIDRDTSGIIVASLDEDSNRQLSIDLQAGRFHKEYRAICHGIPEPADGDWRDAIRDDPTGASIARQCHPSGQASHTEYHVKEVADQGFALLHIVLHTGRQHQIRVHASHNGHPLVGDWTYGPACAELAGQALHAAVLRFPHPHTGKPITVEAPLPPLLAELWTHLRHGGSITPRQLNTEENRRLGLAEELDKDSRLVPGGWRRPSWMDAVHYERRARELGEWSEDDS